MAEATDSQKPSRKPLSRSEAARHASLVRWGKEQPFAARLAAIRERRKAKPKGGKGKGKAAKPDKAQNLASVGDALNEADAALSKNGLAALSAAADGTAPEGAMAEGLIESGLAVRGADGRFRLTPDGRAIVSAAGRGDTNAVLDRLSEMNDKQQAKDKTQGGAEADADAPTGGSGATGELAEGVAGLAKDATAAEKPKGGGGGGGGGKKPKEEAPEEEELTPAQQRAAEARARREALDARVMDMQLRRYERGGTLSDEQRARMEDAGLIDDEGRVTSLGRRRAMTRKERERQDMQDYADRTAGVKRAEVKHGKHNQASHGRRTARRRAFTSAYASARAGGASPAEARALAKEAGLARQGERDARLQRMRGRAQGDRTPKTDGDLTKAYGADPNQSYTMQHKLVDMGDIQASNTPGGAINPKYDPVLQPRDRSRAASQAQIDTVARQMNPDVLTTDFHRIDAGSPIIDANGNVLSGNGRTLALQRAAEQYPEQYAAYRAKLKQEAAALGIDPTVVDKMKNPVLVRELKGDVDTAAFAREANSSGTLRMSPLEQAKVDANVLQDKAILKLNVGDGLDIDRALRDKSNKPFIDDFLKTIPENERANLLTRNGDLNQMGLYRMKAAIYTKAFPGAAGERLAESMLESLDPDVKTIQNGISGALPAFGRATSLTRSGLRDRELDISDDLAKTIDVYARVKDNPNLTANTPAHLVVRKYLDQSSMFDRELNAEQERLLVHIDKISRKPTEVRSFLERYARIVEDQPVPGQASLFGDSRMTRAQLYDMLLGMSSNSGSVPMFGQPQQQGAFL